MSSLDNFYTVHRIETNRYLEKKYITVSSSVRIVEASTATLISRFSPRAPLTRVILCLPLSALVSHLALDCQLSNKGKNAKNKITNKTVQ